MIARSGCSHSIQGTAARPCCMGAILCFSSRHVSRCSGKRVRTVTVLQRPRQQVLHQHHVARRAAAGCPAHSHQSVPVTAFLAAQGEHQSDLTAEAQSSQQQQQHLVDRPSKSRRNRKLKQQPPSSSSSYADDLDLADAETLTASPAGAQSDVAVLQQQPAAAHLTDVAAAGSKRRVPSQDEWMRDIPHFQVSPEGLKHVTSCLNDRILVPVRVAAAAPAGYLHIVTFKRCVMAQPQPPAVALSPPGSTAAAASPGTPHRILLLFLY